MDVQKDPSLCVIILAKLLCLKRALIEELMSSFCSLTSQNAHQMVLNLPQLQIYYLWSSRLSIINQIFTKCVEYKEQMYKTVVFLK